MDGPYFGVQYMYTERVTEADQIGGRLKLKVY